MKLDDRQVSFVVPFWPAWRTRTLRFGSRRGSLHLQETALVVEGELLRFSFIGLEWLFRRALSEWTTVTVPYSRLLAVRRAPTGAIRLLLFLALAATWATAIALFQSHPTAGALTSMLTDVLTVVLTVVPTVVLVYSALRLKPTVKVLFRAKDGRRVRLAFVIRRRPTRQAFLDALAGHRAAAARHTAVPVLAVARR
jgi:hypothetical protein